MHPRWCGRLCCVAYRQDALPAFRSFLRLFPSARHPSFGSSPPSIAAHCKPSSEPFTSLAMHIFPSTSRNCTRQGYFDLVQPNLSTSKLDNFAVGRSSAQGVRCLCRSTPQACASNCCATADGHAEHGHWSGACSKICYCNYQPSTKRTPNRN